MGGSVEERLGLLELGQRRGMGHVQRLVVELDSYLQDIRIVEDDPEQQRTLGNVVRVMEKLKGVLLGLGINAMPMGTHDQLESTVEGIKPGSGVRGGFGGLMQNEARRPMVNGDMLDDDGELEEPQESDDQDDEDDEGDELPELDDDGEEMTL